MPRSGENRTADQVFGNAIQQIKDVYGDIVSINKKKKTLLKFGRSSQVQTTATTLMTLPTGTFNETYVASNLITTVSSSSSSDSSQTLTIEGHTISGSDLTFVTQTAALMGTSQVTLSTALARVTRAYVSSGSSDLVGTIYVYEDDTNAVAGVPDTDSGVHLMIPAGRNQSEKASTSLSSQDYWIITQLTAEMLTKANSFADVELQIRVVGSVFREQFTLSVSDSHRGVINLDPPIIVSKNSDVRLVGIADTNGRDVSGTINGYLAIIV